MTKKHYISFIAAASSDRMQMVKLYPEGNAEARFKINGVKRIFFYCNRDGLFSINVVKGIDDREKSYDDVEERRQLEKVVGMLFVQDNVANFMHIIGGVCGTVFGFRLKKH